MGKDSEKRAGRTNNSSGGGGNSSRGGHRGRGYSGHGRTSFSSNAAIPSSSSRKEIHSDEEDDYRRDNIVYRVPASNLSYPEQQQKEKSHHRTLINVASSSSDTASAQDRESGDDVSVNRAPRTHVGRKDEENGRQSKDRRRRQKRTTDSNGNGAGGSSSGNSTKREARIARGATEDQPPTTAMLPSYGNIVVASRPTTELSNSSASPPASPQLVPTTAANHPSIPSVPSNTSTTATTAATATVPVLPSSSSSPLLPRKPPQHTRGSTASAATAATTSHSHHHGFQSQLRILSNGVTGGPELAHIHSIAHASSATAAAAFSSSSSSSSSTTTTAATTTANSSTSNLLLNMRGSCQLVNDTFKRFCIEDAISLLGPFSSYLTIGFIGGAHSGRAEIIKRLLNYKLDRSELKSSFAEGKTVTKGIEMHVSPDRLIVLDTESLSVPKKSRPFSNDAASLHCLQSTILLLSCCHLLVITQSESFDDGSIIRFCSVANRIRSELLGMDSHAAEPLVLYTNQKADSLNPLTLSSRQHFVDKLMRHSSLPSSGQLVHPCIRDVWDRKYSTFFLPRAATWSPDMDYLKLEQLSLFDELCSQLLEFQRKPVCRGTERDWLQFAERIWNKISGVNLVQMYNSFGRTSSHDVS